MIFFFFFLNIINFIQRDSKFTQVYLDDVAMSFSCKKKQTSAIVVFEKIELKMTILIQINSIKTSLKCFRNHPNGSSFS